MADSDALARKLWKHLHDDRTVMLGLEEEGGLVRPMTALAEGDRPPLWFFTSRDSDLVRRLDGPRAATAAFASKDHAVFASIRGTLTLDTDRAVVARLWNPFIAAWYEGGQDDPKLALLRFDADNAEVWLNENSLLAGVKLLLGMDPKKEYADKVGEVDLGR
ncbi:pyridoxamine 5'-phosphate oxidase family protein [Lysobacter enzymogenes]|uniref:pyridoxamine 5'-phosphate oxidase family protein n=1 Tax=Lysobacter enzymogenes TaxID=69 RepID=UPI003749E07A